MLCLAGLGRVRLCSVNCGCSRTAASAQPDSEQAMHGHAVVMPRQIRTSKPFLSKRFKSFSDGPLGCLSPISH